MNIQIDKLPTEATRSQWSRLLGIPLRKLVYEERMGRLKRRKQVEYNVVYSRESMLEWLREYKHFFAPEQITPQLVTVIKLQSIWTN